MTLAEMAALLGHPAMAVKRDYAKAQDAAHWFPLARDPDWLCRLAAERRLADVLGGAASDLALVELDAWRDYHGTTVRSASSLAFALFEHERLDLDVAVRELGPYGVCPAWLVGPRFAGRARKARWPGRKPAADLRAADGRERFLHSGRVLRWPSDPGGLGLGIHLSSFGLEVGFQLDGLSVRTLADEATVIIRADVPETVRLALVGRPLLDLIDHPALRDRGLVVMDADALAGGGASTPGTWAMTVRAPRLPWRPPWARGWA